MYPSTSRGLVLTAFLLVEPLPPYSAPPQLLWIAAPPLDLGGQTEQAPLSRSFIAATIALSP
jgi:hypothetical protein